MSCPRGSRVHIFGLRLLEQAFLAIPFSCSSADVDGPNFLARRCAVDGDAVVHVNAMYSDFLISSNADIGN